MVTWHCFDGCRTCFYKIEISVFSPHMLEIVRVMLTYCEGLRRERKPWILPICPCFSSSWSWIEQLHAECNFPTFSWTHWQRKHPHVSVEKCVFLFVFLFFFPSSFFSFLSSGCCTYFLLCHATTTWVSGLCLLLLKNKTKDKLNFVHKLR